MNYPNASQTLPSGMTREDVAYRLAEAVSVLYRLPMAPGTLPAEIKALWPDIKPDPSESYGYNDAVLRPGRPSAAAIQRMDQALGWLLWLSAEQRRIVYLHSAGRSFRRIARQHGGNAEHHRAIFHTGIATITRRLARSP